VTRNTPTKGMSVVASALFARMGGSVTDIATAKKAARGPSFESQSQRMAALSTRNGSAPMRARLSLHSFGFPS
jgi:hypothetical protein